MVTVALHAADGDGPAPLFLALAEYEAALCSTPAERWPEVVQRAYHVGRKLAFRDAVAVLAMTATKGETG